jgi:exonuclease SbcD
MQAIILGDPHVGKGLSIGKSGIGATLNSRIVDQLNLLDWTLERAIEYHVDHIIITGDVFEDPKPLPSLITHFIAWLKKCQVYGIHVHIVMGNHDVFRNGFVYNSTLDIISEVDLDNVDVYKDINTITIGTTAFTLVPYRDRKAFSVPSNAEAIALVRDSLVYELAAIPITYRKVLIGHLAIEGSIPVGDEIDDLTNELFCPLDMFQGYDYVWMGHVHKPQVMQKANPYIAHIGSMDISNFGETDHKKHIVIFNCDEDNGWIAEDLPTRQLKKVAITVPKDTEDTTAYVLDELKKLGSVDKAIVRVEIGLGAPELTSVNKSTIEKYLSSQGAFNITGISESRKLALIKKDINNTIDTKMDVPAAIKTYGQTYVPDKERPAFIELAMEIHNLYKMEGKE